MWRWLRLLGLLLLGLLVALTLAAIAFDFVTAGDSRPAQQLYPGPFVRVGDTLVAYRRWATTGEPDPADRRRAGLTVARHGDGPLSGWAPPDVNSGDGVQKPRVFPAA